MFKHEVAGLLSGLVDLDKDKILDLIEIPPEGMGDYAFPCFALAKQMKKAPPEIARELAANINSENIERVEAKGPYLNFFIRHDVLAKAVLTSVEKGLEQDKPNGKTVVIEFPAPNTNKPLHLGHVRNLLLGESVSRLLEFCGNKVHRVDLVNDRGIHICKSMLAYRKWGLDAQPDKKPDHFVGDFYVLYNEKQNPDLEQEARQMLLDWENQDPATLELWKMMRDWALKGFRQTFTHLGITHDKTYYESDIYKKGKQVVEQAFKKGIFTEDENGNIIADLKKYNLPPKVLLRADRTSIYMTRDIYLAKERMQDYGFDKCIYVVGSEQKLHFQQLFRILEMLGYEDHDKYHHLSYGMIFLPEGKMKSREGKIVDADILIEDVETRARKAIQERHELSEDELNKRAEMIGLGGLKFFVLKYDPQKDFVFNSEESISFEGETGPYVQYTHARICSILRKQEASQDVDFTNLEIEKPLIKKMSTFRETVHDAAVHYKPSLIARFLLDICQEFNEYYHKNHILTAKPQVRDARLLFIACIKNIIARGLYLLGIDAPEQM